MNNAGGRGIAGWFGWGGLVLTAALVAVSSGIGAMLVLSGLYVLVVAVIALVRGHVSWALLRSRGIAGVALIAAIGLFAAGGAATDTPAPSVAQPSSTTSSSSSPVPSSATTSTAPPPASTSSATSTASGTPSPVAATTTAPAQAKPGTALAAVGALVVKGRGPKTGYSREAFGRPGSTRTATGATPATTSCAVI